MAIKTTNIPASNIISDVLGNREDGGVERTVRIPIESLILLLTNSISATAFGGATYPSIEDGEAVTAAGDYFAVPGGAAGGGVAIYRATSGAAVEVATLPGAAIAADLAAAIARAEGAAPDLARQTGIRDRYVVGTRPRALFTDTWGPADYLTWMIAFHPPRDIRTPSAVIWRLLFAGQPARVGMRIVRRPAAVGDGAPGALVWPSAHAEDETVQDVTWHDGWDVLADPTAYAIPQICRLPVSVELPMTRDWIWFCQIYARDATDTPLPLGVQRGRQATVADPLWKRGGFSPDPTPGAGGFTPSDGAMVAATLTEVVYVAGDGVAATDQDPARLAFVERPARFYVEDGGTAWTVRLPVVSVDLQPAPVAQDSTGENVLGVPKVSSGPAVRYDAAGIDADTGQIHVIPGTERVGDAVEYRPSHGGYSRLGYLRTHSGGVELIRTDGYQDYVRTGDEGRFIAHVRRNRLLLPATVRALARGQQITLIPYGDSIDAISAGVTTDYYAPGGSNRDVVGYLTDYGADTIAALPRYAGDGGPEAHVHIGSHWYVRAAIEAHGSPCVIMNMGVGGTTSADGTTSGAPNARNPTRLASLLDLVATQTNPLVTLGYGMNQLGVGGIYDDYLALISAIRAAGGEVLVVSCPRPGRRNGVWALSDSWAYTTRQSIRAARAENCAFVDSSQLFGDGTSGSTGISPSDLCSANGSNHPGVTELRCRGEFIAMNVIF